MPTQPCLNIDESPTKEASRKSWLWTFVAQPFTVFAVRATRAATALSDLLTNRFQGIVTCDRAKMYSFGTQSAKGSRFVETLLTVIETCRQQSRNVFQFLTTAIAAHFANQNAPSLATGP